IIDLAFEHRLYLSLASVTVLAVIGIYELLGLLNRQELLDLDTVRWSGFVMAAVAMLVLGGLTFARNADYASAEIMYRDVVAKRPASTRARTLLGAWLAKLGKLDEALPHLHAAVTGQRPGHLAFLYYGAALGETGRVAEAVAPLEKAVEMAPTSQD